MAEELCPSSVEAPIPVPFFIRSPNQVFLRSSALKVKNNDFNELHYPSLRTLLCETVNKKADQLLSFQWLQTTFRVSSMDSKGRGNLYGTVPYERTAQKLSFEWSHTRVSSTNLKS